MVILTDANKKDLTKFNTHSLKKKLLVSQKYRDKCSQFDKCSTKNLQLTSYLLMKNKSFPLDQVEKAALSLSTLLFQCHTESST